jgi:hypothetical protein
MHPHNLSLRALLSEGADGSIQAQLLELDIAVRADSLDGVLREFEHAIIVLYQAARKDGATPFATTREAPARFRRKWESLNGNGAAAPTEGRINLPPEIADALAIRLRADRAALEIPVFRLAA